MSINKADLPVLQSVPGEGVLARSGDLVMLCRTAPGQEARTAGLAETLSSLAAMGGDGRLLGRHLSRLLEGAGPEDDFPALCAFGPAGEGIAALVHGDAEMSITTGTGQEVQFDGRQPVTTIDWVIPGPITSVRATLGTHTGPNYPEPWSRLDAGIIRADALLYRPRRTLRDHARGLPGLRHRYGDPQRPT